jgi:hypothetical protein
MIRIVSPGPTHSWYYRVVGVSICFRGLEERSALVREEHSS